jgi:hypothetical protein
VQVDVPRDAVVIRFRPVDASRVMEWAGKEYRRTRHYRLSVFAAAPGPGESSEAAEARLLDAAGLAGIDLARQPKYFVTTAGALLDAGFTFWKDEEPGELVEHYSVDLGERLTLAVVNRFLGQFGVTRRLPWLRG